MSEDISHADWLEQEKRKFAVLLAKLRKAAGLTQVDLGHELGLSGTSISDLERAVFRATPDRDLVMKWIKLCAERPGSRPGELPSAAKRQYEIMVRPLEEATDRRAIRRPTAPPSNDQDEWVDLVQKHAAWQRVDRDRNLDVWKQQAEQIAAALSSMRADTEIKLQEDPWQDPAFALRFTERLEWLIDRAIPPEALRFSPAEATLLILSPLIHHTNQLRAASSCLDVNPCRLGRTDSDPDTRRGRYEQYLRTNTTLVNRAAQPSLPDRAPASKEIGWWLFHRWLAGSSFSLPLETVESLLGASVPVGRAEDVFTEKRVTGLLRMLRVAPNELRSADRFDLASTETIFGGSRAEQQIRARLLGFLLAFAHALAIELTGLPTVIVEHLGIPNPVDLPALRTTVARASWDLVRGGTGLVAECQHEAALEALKDHVSHVEAILQTAHAEARSDSTLAVLLEVSPQLSANGVRPISKPDRSPLFNFPSVRFQLDENRVRQLLMGEQLYQDRSLAIRELYQNALDACRYREARNTYLSAKTDHELNWEGRITFKQDVDGNGRHYIECSDNGVGMGETELRGAFANVGIRFADLSEFAEEREDWARAGVELHPNSRFGIGVMSYFMLANEVELTTCRMDRRGGEPGPVLKVAIAGPGHLFRIQRVAEQGDRPGTTVRLYLAPDITVPSCVSVLRKILAIAEFPTTATHGDQRDEWRPGALHKRTRPSWETDGIDIGGSLVYHGSGPGQVVWCEEGGAILVDGLYSRPVERNRVLASPDQESDIRGVVVNLSRHLTPSLSVDRRQILSDVSSTVEPLIQNAINELLTAETGPFNLEWLDQVSAVNPRLADLIVTRAIESNHSIPHTNPRVYRFQISGLFLGDKSLRGLRLSTSGMNISARGMPNNIFLWRQLAYANTKTLDLPADLQDQLRRSKKILPALPSDTFILTSNDQTFGNYRSWVNWSEQPQPGHILYTSAIIGISPREVAERGRLLGLTIDPNLFSDHLSPDKYDLAILSYNRDGKPPWLSTKTNFSAGHVLLISRQLELGFSDVLNRLTQYGFPVSGTKNIDHSIDSIELEILRAFIPDASSNRSSISSVQNNIQLVSPLKIARISKELNAPYSTTHRILVDYGLADSSSTSDEPTDEECRLMSMRFDGRTPSLTTGRQVGVFHAFQASKALNIPFDEVTRTLERFGYQMQRKNEVLAGLERYYTKEDKGIFYDESLMFEAELDASRPVSIKYVLHASKRVNQPPHKVAERLKRYGYIIDPNHAFWTEVTDADWPLFAFQLDTIFVSLASYEFWKNAHPESSIPAYVTFATLIRSRKDAEAIVGRLRELHLNVADLPLFDKNSLHTHSPLAMTIAAVQQLSQPISDDSWNSSLQMLTSRRFQTDQSFTHVVELTREFGLDIPDIGELLSDAIRGIPRAHSHRHTEA